MQVAEMNATFQGPGLITLVHPVIGPVTHSIGEPVGPEATTTGQSSPRSDTNTDISPLADLALEYGPITFSMHVAETNALSQGPELITFMHTLDLADEASDEIPRLTRHYTEQNNEGDPIKTLTNLHRILSKDLRTDVSDLALGYESITGPVAEHDFAADILDIRLQYLEILTRIKALEGRNMHGMPTPGAKGNQRARDYKNKNKQRSREQREDRREKNNV